MPDEEMEIMADFGHEGFAEDIDIDLDLAAAAHPDEDLELADFDHTADMHIFNSDGRDEMMAEGDDASYGMVDADDIEIIQTTTNTDDIEIDLGGMGDGDSWQEQANTTVPSDINEIDFVDADDNVLDRTEHDDQWHDDEAAVDVVDTNKEPSISETLHTDAVEGASGLQQQSAEVVPLSAENDSSTTVVEQSTSIVETIPPQVGNADGVESTPTTAENEGISQSNDASEIQHEGTPDEGKREVETGVAASGAEAQSLTDTDDQAQIEELNGSYDTTEQEEPTLEATESLEHVEFGEPEEQNEVQPAASPKPRSMETQAPEVAEQPSEQGTSATAQDIDYGDVAGADELNEPSTLEVEDHDDLEQRDHESDEPSGNQVTEETNEDQPPAESVLREDLESVTARHALVISYKRTDYRLFAESEDDDPDAYFLKDHSILNAAMGDFLAALRDIVSGEISPLDELVLHVDGLGLDFAESSSPLFLKEHTFGELLVLYDQLTLNDGAETVPPFYSYLLIRPSGAARLLALQESAKSGHGLSQVAHYREFSPDEDMDDAHSSAVSDSGSENFGAAENVHNVVDTQDEDNHSVEQAMNEAHEERPEQDRATVQPDTAETAEVNAEDGEAPVADEEFYDELDLSPHDEDEGSAGRNERLEHLPSKGLADQDATQHDEPVQSAESSATVTANGDEHDEIGYSDDEDEIIAAKVPEQVESATANSAVDLLEVPVPDDEITWESEHEDDEEDIKLEAAQTSPVAGKRTHSESTGVNDTSEQNGVKRQRS